VDDAGAIAADSGNDNELLQWLGSGHGKGRG
jgi:hypothetical protein